MSYNVFRCFDIVYNVVICISPSSPQTVTPTGNTTVSFNYWSNATLVDEGKNWTTISPGSRISYSDLGGIIDSNEGVFTYTGGSDFTNNSGNGSFYIWIQFLPNNYYDEPAQAVMKLHNTHFSSSGYSHTWEFVEKSSNCPTINIATDTNCGINSSTKYSNLKNNSSSYNKFCYGKIILFSSRGDQMYGPSQLSNSYYLPFVEITHYHSSVVTFRYKKI